MQRNRKTIEWERLEIFSRKLEISREHFMQRKNRNSMGLREAEDIKKRWQEYTALYRKDLNDPDNHNGVITHLGPKSWSVKLSGPLEASLQTKLVEVIEFQLSHFRS